MFFKFLSRFMGGRVTPPLPIDCRVEPQVPSNLPPMTTQPVSYSSPSSSSFTHDSSWTYDVFLSFRGEDTRTNFTDHLHGALVRKGIRTFIDRELVRGEEISPALVEAIEGSRISLIVFSENYASSRWCLDELVKILQCKGSKQQIVLPIFYKVDPSDVRHQRSSYGDEFVHHERKFKNDKEKVLKWRRALEEAANLSGWHFKEEGYETTFIDNIVDEILSRVLSCTYLPVVEYPVGIQSHVQDVEMLLDVGGNGRHMVGIWGTSGIGKTTIAKAIFNAVAYKFEGSSFLPNVREGSLIQLQETLLQEILGGNKLTIASADKGISIIHKLLRHKKILLILDDVNQLEQLDNLARIGWFGEGSRVIITTQNRGLLKSHGIELIYKVRKLYDDKALELFSLNAFGRNEPPNDYLELAQRAIAYAQGLPLALTLLGRHLREESVQYWQAILDDYKGEPYTHVERILQKSYDALDDDAKEFYLDIACFFKGEYKDYVLQIVPKKFIEEFVRKAMITIEWNKILMHDLLANLGKDIVRKESPNDPGQRSRLWFYEDVIQVLTEITGTRNIKGIMVKLLEPTEITLNPECFRNMVNLEIFINRNASLGGHINYLPNALRCIDWGTCQLQSLPANFQGNRLVVFHMPRSHIRLLERFKHLPNLKSMNLSGCQFLEKIPDLSGIPNIEYLNLSECTRLVEVDGFVGFLHKLVELNLDGCVKLMRFATRLRLKSLERLYLCDCKRLESFPEIEVEMESLRNLNMRGSGIRELPPSIAYLTGLRDLDLGGCFNLTRFGTELRLKSLEELDLSDCKRLESFPEIEVEMESLRNLNMRGSGIRELPPSIAYLTGLRDLDLGGCFNLTRFGTALRLKSLEKLDLSDCKRLESFPEIEVDMESLRTLGISGSGVRELPSTIAYLPGFEVLKADCSENRTITVNSQVSSSNSEFGLKGCNLSKSDFLVPLHCWSTLTELDLSGNNFVNLPTCFSKFVNLQGLNLSACKGLLEVPEQALPPRVHWVNLDNCTSLEKIPKVAWVLLDNCRSLEEYGNTYLSLINCVRLRGYDITENIFRNQVSVTPLRDFHICLPGDEFPKWFSCRKDATLVNSEIFYGRCEVKFEIPPNLKWETLKLVLCVVTETFSYDIHVKILVNGSVVNKTSYGREESHVRLKCIPLLDMWYHSYGLQEPLKQGDMCQVIFELDNYVSTPVKMPSSVKMTCGVHLLGHQVADVTVDRGQRQWLLPDAMAVDDDIHDDQHQDNEVLSLPSASETSLGKRPRLSDFMALDDDHRANVVDIGDHEAQRGEADHPKRRHIDLNEEPKQ